MKRAALRELKLKDRKDLIGAEIGTWRGGNAVEMLTDLDIKKLYLIDPYAIYDGWGFEVIGNGNHDLSKEKGKVWEDLVTSKRIAKEVLESFEDRIIWIERKSSVAAEIIEEPLDFVYIDGNHDYKFVSEDIEIWTPKVKKGGLVSGHDYNIPDVAKAVLEYCKKHKIKLETRVNKLLVNAGPLDWWFIKEENK